MSFLSIFSLFQKFHFSACTTLVIYKPVTTASGNIWTDMKINDDYNVQQICQLTNQGLSDEEIAMFDYTEHSWSFFQENIEMFIKQLPNFGAIIFGVRIMPDAELGLDTDHKVSNIKDRLTKLLFGFPSVKIPAESDSFFWWMKGNNMGFDNMVNGDFNAKTLRKVDLEGQGIDGGPFMIFNKNQKDALIISQFSSKEEFLIRAQGQR